MTPDPGVPTERTQTVIAQTTTGPQPPERVDFVLILLFAGMFLFTILLLIVEKIFPMDGQIFQIMAGLVTAFSGAFFGRILPSTPRTPR